MANFKNALSIDGWVTEKELEWLANRVANSRNILELGPWLGRATRAFVDNAQGMVTCIDLWDGDSKESLILPESQVENLQTIFLYNLQGASNLRVIKASFEEGLQQLPYDYYDFIFIDGAADYESFKRDLLNCYQYLSYDGVLCGRRYTNSYPGVKKALREILPEAKPVGADSLWISPPKGLLRNSNLT